VHVYRARRSKVDTGCMRKHVEVEWNMLVIGVFLYVCNCIHS
jgi:hypothetical protein